MFFVRAKYRGKYFGDVMTNFEVTYSEALEYGYVSILLSNERRSPSLALYQSSWKYVAGLRWIYAYRYFK